MSSNLLLPVTVVIPTYRREQVLVDTIDYLLALQPRPAEVVVVDQTENHAPATQVRLQALHAASRISWIRLPRPSITGAMNVGLQHAGQPVVVFVDDDIVPDGGLVRAHHEAQQRDGVEIVAGQVLQPGQSPTRPGGEFPFTNDEPAWINDLMGGNFSVKRDLALTLGGFDENFVHVAYRFEAEFCARALARGNRIYYEPAASIRHLRVKEGGTRSFGDHLTTVKPSHAVGEYYYLLRAQGVRRRVAKMVVRLFRSIRTRHHLRRPWWIPGTLLAEMLGFLWALRLWRSGPRLLPPTEPRRAAHD